MFQYQTMMYRFNVLLSGVATCLEKEETCVTVIHAVSPPPPTPSGCGPQLSCLKFNHSNSMTVTIVAFVYIT